ncbi:hypothetical protein [Sphingomonas sp. 22R3R2A-7]|uniref:hypothetical protein n=1 Tax=Sphingomonas sp. 22R3R2A-7 TaxID=3050230 RepID=UPI002FDF65CC
MTRPISEPQFTALWFDEFANGSGVAVSCILCGNSGRIDTRGRVFNGWGDECGGEALCICPTGRKFKQQVEKARREDAP